ncbi:hypothetical protein ACFX2J_022300 [Malus domestica]
MDYTKYCTFHRGPDHTIDDYYTWKNYLKKLVKEGNVDRYLDKPVVQPRRNANSDESPPNKAIWINDTFVEFEHLGATNNSKKRKIQQALLVLQDAQGVDFPHDDALVVFVQLAHTIVDMMMVNNGNVVNLLQLSVIQKMGLENNITRLAEVLTEFNGHTSTAIGHITFDVKTLPQTDQKDGVQTYTPAYEMGWKPKEDVKHIILDPQQPEKITRIGSRLSPKENEKLMAFLRENHDVFAWSPSNMFGIDPKIACHKLHVDAVAKWNVRATYQIFVNIMFKKQIGVTMEVYVDDIMVKVSLDDLKVLSSIHEGVCGNNFGGRSLAQKAFNAGYYWLTMHQNDKELVQKCDSYQCYKPVPALHANKLQPRTSPWLFMQWAIDLVGPWVEAKPMTTTTQRFGFFQKYGIKQHLSTPRYPQGNGLAEASNKMILDCLMKSLFNKKGKWLDELLGYLWAYRITK